LTLLILVSGYATEVQPPDKDPEVIISYVVANSSGDIMRVSHYFKSFKIYILKSGGGGYSKYSWVKG
jgi:hypothetical protein